MSICCRTSISSLESRLTNGSPGSSFSKTYASVSEISSPHIIQTNNNYNHQAPIQQYTVQQQPIIKPPILPPKAGMGITHSSPNNNDSNNGNGSRAMLSENGNLFVVHKQQPPYVAPPFYENIQDVATSSKIQVLHKYHFKHHI